MACDPVLLGLSQQDDDFDTPAAWAPMHAWRALGQLRAETAVERLLQLRRTIEDDCLDLDLPVVLGLIGPPALPQIAAFLEDGGVGDYAAIAAISALPRIAKHYPDAGARCIDLAVRLLGVDLGKSDTIAGFAIAALIDLNAAEAIAVIRDAFGRDAVEISVAGDLEAVEISLGLREKRDTPAPHYIKGAGGWIDDLRGGNVRVHNEAWSKDAVEPAPRQPVRRTPKIGRNEPCPCGSGKKFKKCCLNNA